VGKTALLTKYIKGEFTDAYNVTVGVEFTSKTVRIDEKTQVKLQIWDTVYHIIRRQDRKHSELLCDLFIKEYVAYFLLSASTIRIVSIAWMAG
jgi:GTPase SAR1 family protein